MINLRLIKTLMVSSSLSNFLESFGNPSPYNPVEIFKSTLLHYCEARLRILPSLKILWLIATNGISNLLNFNIAYVFPRFMYFVMALTLSEDETLSIGFSKTMQNLLCDQILWAVIVIVNTEVGKILGSGERLDLAPKILYYSIIICLAYNFFIFLPLVLYTQNILRVTTKLEPSVVEMIYNMNLATYVPALICNTNLGAASYFQSLGYGKEIFRWNSISMIFTAAFFLATYYLGWGIASYISTCWVIAISQIIVSFGFYFFKIEPEFRITDFSICFKHLGYLIIETFKNGFIEYLDYFDTQVLIVLSSILLGPEENAAITFGLTLLSTITMGCYPAIRLPYVSLTEIITEKHHQNFRSMFWNCNIAVLIYTSMCGLPYIIFKDGMAENSFNGDAIATQYLKDEMFLTVSAGVLKNSIFFYLDIMKGIKHRGFAILSSAVKTAAFFGLSYLLIELKIVEEGGIGLLLSLNLSMIAQFIVYQIYFTFLDWKKISESVEILH